MSNRARVFWELNWDGRERTRKAAFAEARRQMRAGKQVIVEQVWVWGPRPGFPNGKRIELGRWYCLAADPTEPDRDRRLHCTRRALLAGAYDSNEAEAARIYKRKYRRWRPSYDTWM